MQSTYRRPHYSKYCTKDGRVHLSCQQVSQMFDCFPYFFTNHAFGIVALICNLNLNGLSPTLHQAYLTRLKQCCSCGWIHLFVGLPHPVVDTSVNLIYFLM